MPNIDFLNEFFAPVIVGICLCAGFVVKKWVADIDNKFIPTICAVLGVGLAVWINFPTVTPEVVLTGLFSGLAATGLFEALRNLLEKK